MLHLCYPQVWHDWVQCDVSSPNINRLRVFVDLDWINLSLSRVVWRILITPIKKIMKHNRESFIPQGEHWSCPILHYPFMWTSHECRCHELSVLCNIQSLFIKLNNYQYRNLFFQCFGRLHNHVITWTYLSCILMGSVITLCWWSNASWAGRGN